MALKIRTVMTYPLTGSTVDFMIPFEYLARKFVTVTLVGTDRKELVLNQDYRFTTKNQITTARAWGSNDGYELIEVRRYTSATERLVDFADGSILRAYDLNISQVQTLHVAEEARDLTADTIGVNNDGHLDARGRRIVNVADPVGDFDALNLRTVKVWNDSAYQSYIKAQQEATRSTQQADRSTTEADRAKREADRAAASQGAAARSESAAAASERNAASSERNAASSASAGKASEVAARASEVSAKEHADRSNTEANRSKGEADRAKSEADKLGNMNELATAIEKVTDKNVYWKNHNNAWYHGFTTLADKNQILFALRVDESNKTLKLDANTSITGTNWNVDFSGAVLHAQDMRAKSVIRLTDGQAEYNWTLKSNEKKVQVNSANLTEIHYGPLSITTSGRVSAETFISRGDFVARGNHRHHVTFQRDDGQSIMFLYKDLNSDVRLNNGVEGGGDFVVRRDGGIMWGVNGAWSASDGNVWGTQWGGWLADYMKNTFLVEVAQGGQTHHGLNNQGTWECPNGHSLTGWISTPGDGNIKYTTWITRQLMRRTVTSGWIGCGRIA